MPWRAVAGSIVRRLTRQCERLDDVRWNYGLASRPASAGKPSRVRRSRRLTISNSGRETVRTAAALVIDWLGTPELPPLAWGYRWSGNATGVQMFRSVVQADPRFVREDWERRDRLACRSTALATTATGTDSR